MDFNNAPAQTEGSDGGVIYPEDSIVKATCKLKYGDAGDTITFSKNNSKMLTLIFEIESEYGGSIFHHIVIEKFDVATQQYVKNDHPVMLGQFRAMIESMWNLTSDNMSEEAKRIRIFPYERYAELDGKECVIKLGYKPAEGKYSESNKIKLFINADDPNFVSVKQGNNIINGEVRPWQKSDQGAQASSWETPQPAAAAQTGATAQQGTTGAAQTTQGDDFPA